MRLAVLLALLAALATPARAQLSGTYTLGPSSSSDFASVEDAASALRDLGVDGPVVIEVEQATYAERLDLGDIEGASATNTVTFRGIAAGQTLPVLTYTPSAGEPNVVALSKADWVRLETLRFEIADRTQSFGTVIHIEADHVIVSDCQIRSITAASVGANEAVGIDVLGSDVTIQDTEVDEGDIGIRYGVGPSGPTSGGQILRNALDRNKSAGVLVEDQSVVSGVAISIRENHVLQNAVDAVGWVGIWIRGLVGGAVLARNYIVPRSGTGLRIENVTNATTAWTSVVNNAVLGDAFRYNGSSMGIELLDAKRVRVLNNTVKINSLEIEARDGGTALRVDAASSSVRVVNNILVHQGWGPLLDIESLASVIDLDYQVFEARTAPDLFRARIAGTEFTDLGAYRAATGASAHTIAWPVEFGSGLRLAGASDGDGNLIGQPDPAVPADIDGEPRDATRPYRGADEAATPLDLPPPLMSGIYRLGPGGDYASFTAAFEALDLRGLGGPVTFLVRAGVYDERVDAGPTRGASSVRTVTFAAAPGDAVLQYDTSTYTFDFVLRLTNVQHVAFEGLTFRSLDAQYASIAWIRGGNDITFQRCAFLPATPDPRGTLIHVGGWISGGPERNPRDIRVLDSEFVGGRTAIDINVVNGGGAFQEEGGFEVIGNTITGLHPTFDGIHMNGLASGIIRGNVVAAPTSDAGFVGISVGGSSSGATQSDVIVEANRVTANDGVGILWSGYRPNGVFGPELAYRLVNNTVRMNGDGETVGIRIDKPEGLLSAFNTASVGSTNPASAAVRVDASFSTTDLDLRNNVFDANAGRALDLTTYGLVGYVYDDNVFWTDGAVLATYDLGSRPTVDCADLACIQEASYNFYAPGNQDLHSVHRRVEFVDAAGGDLHLAPSMIGGQDLAGVGIAEVTADLDGDPRSPTRPYRGADEAQSTLSYVSFRLRVFLEGAFVTGCGTDCVELSTALQDGGHLPLANPYADPSFDGTLSEYDGTEAVTQAQLESMAPIVDWVVVALRETPDGPDVIRRALLLSYRGYVLGLDGHFDLTLPIPARDYHVVVYHRNHAPVMSVAASLVDESSTFTIVRLYRTQDLYGGAAGAALLPSYGYYGMAAGDGSGDGRVTAPDFNVFSLASAAGAAGYRIEDYTLDGLVTAPDFNLYSQNAAAGAASAVPDSVPDP